MSTVGSVVCLCLCLILIFYSNRKQLSHHPSADRYNKYIFGLNIKVYYDCKCNRTKMRNHMPNIYSSSHSLSLSVSRALYRFSYSFIRRNLFRFCFVNFFKLIRLDCWIVISSHSSSSSSFADNIKISSCSLSQVLLQMNTTLCRSIQVNHEWKIFIYYFVCCRLTVRQPKKKHDLITRTKNSNEVTQSVKLML